MAWLVTGYEQARAALVEPRLAKKEPPFAEDLDPTLRSAINRSMLNVDMPEHGRLRRLVAAAFTRRRVDRLAPRIQQLTDELLDPLAGRVAATEVDLIAEFAYPLPIAVICELLGVPENKRENFRKWSWADVNASVIGLEAYAEAATAFVDYLHDLIAAKRRPRGRPDLGVRRRARRQRPAQRGRADVDDVPAAGRGARPPVIFIANAVDVLLSQNGAWAHLASEPERVPAAVEELLRFNGPVQTSALRAAVERFELAGTTIEAGDTVLVGLLAANRDPGRPGAQVLDLSRSPNQHIAFGHGIHLCLGAPLARLEAQIALTSLLARFPDLRPAEDEIRADPGLLINALRALPVTTRPTDNPVP